MHTHTHIHSHTHALTHMHEHTHARTHTYTHTHTHKSMHTHSLILYSNMPTPKKFFFAAGTIEQSDECLCHNPCHATHYPHKMSMLQLRHATIDKLKKDQATHDHLHE